MDGTNYGDAARYDEQRDRVLARGWHVLGDRFALDGVTAAPATLMPGSLDVPLIVTPERVLSNACTHRGALLLDAPCTTGSIRCPYHGRRFALDGTVVAAPGFDVAPEEHLPTLPRRALGPLVFTSLDARDQFDALVAPLSTRLGFLDLDAMRPDPAATRSYEIEAHWLLWCENYLEGFHIPYVHPRLARALDLDRYEVHAFDRCSLQIGEASKGEACFELPPDHPDAGRRIGGYYAFLYPTTALNLYPWGLSVNLVRPLGPRRTRIEYRAYVTDDALRDRGAGAGLDAVELEDDSITTRAQRGVSSRLYRPGRLSDEHEAGVAWLHRCLAEDLASE